MNVVDPDAELTLELARVAGEPSAADRLRNLEALRARLGSPASAAPGSSGAGSSTPVGVVGRAAAGGARGAATRWVSNQKAQLVRLLTFGALTGVLGFWLGTSTSGPDTAEPHTAAEPGAAERGAAEPDRAEVAASEPTRGGARAPEREALEATWPRAGAAAKSESAAPDLATTPSTDSVTHVDPPPPSGPLHRAPQRTSRAATPPRSARAIPAVPSASSDPTFREAVRLLQRAQRAIDAGEPAVGMSLLDELDARFPPELLNEERQAARVLGWCASGETDRAFAAARALGVQNAGSIYRPRLERSCVALAIPREKN